MQLQAISPQMLAFQFRTGRVSPSHVQNYLSSNMNETVHLQVFIVHSLLCAIYKVAFRQRPLMFNKNTVQAIMKIFLTNYNSLEILIYMKI